MLGLSRYASLRMEEISCSCKTVGSKKCHTLTFLSYLTEYPYVLNVTRFLGFGNRGCFIHRAGFLRATVVHIRPHNCRHTYAPLSLDISALLVRKNNFTMAFTACLLSKRSRSAEVTIPCFVDMSNGPWGLTFQELLHVLQSHMQSVWKSEFTTGKVTGTWNKALSVETFWYN